jgi:demethylmenaquinone methyltransferase/2-methoxy-6-polyprenyl-1,4-benzoquinol methylase
MARGASAILGTDYNADVLAIAGRKNCGGCSVEFRLADAYSLADVPPGFTAGFSGFWWSHVPRAKLAEFLAVFHSKLKTNARVMFIDNVYVEGSSTPVSRQDDDGNTYQIRKLSDGSQHEVLKNFPTDREIREKLSPFSSSIGIERLTYYWVAEYNLERDDEPEAEN